MVADAELKLECMKLAMEQARREATSDLIRVAELQIWFYNHISESAAIAPAPEPEKVAGKRKAQAADKSDIYR